MKNSVLILRRFFSTKTPPAGYKQRPETLHLKHDYIGPPDKESNIRPIVRHSSAKETELEYALRNRQNQVQQWNQEFWASHNKRFVDEKAEFIAKHKTIKTGEISADKMSEFYKKFLDKNWSLHFYYNISWYMKNSELLLLAAQVNISKMLFWRSKK